MDIIFFKPFQFKKYVIAQTISVIILERMSRNWAVTLLLLVN